MEVAGDCELVLANKGVTVVTRGATECVTAPMTLREVMWIALMVRTKLRRRLSQWLAAEEVPHRELISGVIDGVATGVGESIWRGTVLIVEAGRRLLEGVKA